MIVKALSLKQPWAELVVSGKKKIELRKWNTHFRGEFMIHASKISDINAMKRFGFNNLPCGAIIGKAKLIDVKHYEDEKELSLDANLHLANNEWGSFGFLLGEVERLDKPIVAKGSLNFWNYENGKI